MKRSGKNKFPGKICIPIVETSIARARRAIRLADRQGDLVELRMDYLKSPRLEELLKEGGKPLIVTHRRAEEGGRFRGRESDRLAVLRAALDLGVEFVDVEAETGRSFLSGFLARRGKTRLVLSFHDFTGTPLPGDLRGRLRRMGEYSPDVVKIVTFARSWEDNLKVLSLIPEARERKQEIVAFCMGEKGKMSRIFAPLMGASWTYASLDKKRISAPGQLTAPEMRRIWRNLQ